VTALNSGIGYDKLVRIGTTLAEMNRATMAALGATLPGGGG
jgi:hypothetical protein